MCQPFQRCKRPNLFSSSLGMRETIWAYCPESQVTFTLSSDPNFVAKVRDVAGLYVSPPEHAIVLCVDEKSQIQALDRSQPMLPMRPGQAARRSMTTKDMAPHLCSPTSILRRTHLWQVLRGRRRIPQVPRRDRSKRAGRVRRSPGHRQLRTHKTPLIQRGLVKRPRWHVHLTPTSSSWSNQVERFFALLTGKKIRRGVYRSVAILMADIASFIARQTPIPNRSDGPNPPMTSLPLSCASVLTVLRKNKTRCWELLVQDARRAPSCSVTPRFASRSTTNAGN